MTCINSFDESHEGTREQIPLPDAYYSSNVIYELEAPDITVAIRPISEFSRYINYGCPKRRIPTR
jgi:hypothetical protein